MDKQKVNALLLKDLGNDAFDQNDTGIYFPRHGIQAQGMYFDRVNGGDWTITPNLIVKEGLVYILNSAIGSKAKASGFYLALFGGSTAPAANWTAANFDAVASEIKSLTEGYTLPTRPQFVPTDASDNTYIDNQANVAKLSIATTSQLNVTGSALLTSSARGGTTGALISATKYAAARTFQNGDTFEVGYRIALTS